MKIFNKINYGPIVIFGLLIVAVGFMGYIAIGVRSETLRVISEDTSVSSNEAEQAYFEEASTKNSTEQSGNVISSQSKTSNTPTKVPNTNPVNNIVGNRDPEVEPKVATNVTPPKTSIDSIRVFYSAIKAKDFKTANALMGPVLANQITDITQTIDPDKALAKCSNDNLCTLILGSFNPPVQNYTTKKYTSMSGNNGEQISFKLSESSPTVASQIGDYNIDVFSEEYAGNIWVIQAIYINGSPISNYF